MLSLSVLFRNKIFDFIFTDAFHHRISAATLFQRLNGMDLDSYYHNRIIRWAGHVARMPMTRAPRQLSVGLPVDFKEWRAIAKDRSGWGSRAYSKPVPPSEN